MPLSLPSRHTLARKFLAVLVLLLTIHSPRLAALTLHVDHTATGLANGSDWDNAFPDLQSALAAANSGDDIWVAIGTYYPDLGAGQTNNLRTSTFTLLNGVTLYGGFSGSEDLLIERDTDSFPTILSGDLLQNDLTTGAIFDNAFHVLTGTGADATAVIDGFVISSGHASNPAPNNGGGGFVCDSGASPTITNCSFTGNLAEDLGAAAYIDNSSSPTFTNCSFAGNHASFLGGAVCSTNSSTPSFINCSFAGNAATGTSAYGGAVYTSPSSSTTLINSVLWNNSATTSGSQFEGPLSPASSNNLVDGSAIAGHVIANTNPLFVSNPDPGTDGVWTGVLDNDYGNLKLQSTSPAENVGLNTANSTTLDLATASRLQNGAIDLGAYESPFIQTVTNNNNSGPGSLRQLIANLVSPGGGTIIFDPSLDSQTITLSGGVLLLDKSLIIDGSSLPNGVTVDADQTSRVFEITTGNTVVLDSFTITGGKTSERAPGANGTDNPGGTGGDGQAGTPSDSGGGIMNTGNLTLNRMTLTGNRTGTGGNGGNGGSGATPGNGGDGARSGEGGAIYNAGTLHIINSTITNNETGAGGNAGAGNTFGIAGPGGAGGGIFNAGILTILHGTITQNTVGASGTGTPPTMNAAGGLKQAGQLSLSNTIIAQNNSLVAGPDLDGVVDEVSGVNFIGNPSGASGLGPNVLSGDPLLGPLTSNGGPTQTLRPTFASPVVDPANGDSISTLTIDQRGLDRVVSGIVDIGAVEAFLSTVVTTTADSGTGSLRDSINIVENGATITFAPSLDGAAIVLSSGELEIDKTLLIDATDLPLGVTVDAANASRAFAMDDSDDATPRVITLKNLTITGGNSPGNGGGISNREALSLIDCVLDSNTAAGHGGALWISLGSATLTNTTLSNNTASGTGGGGGVRLETGATLTLSGATFTGNNASNPDLASLGGGSITAIAASTLNIDQSTFQQDSSATRGGSLSILTDAANITNSLFSTNSSDNGGAVHITSAAPTLFQCKFIENNSTSSGGALSIASLSNPEVNNCLFSGNSSTVGGAVALDDSFSAFTNCAFIGNNSSSLGGAVHNANSSSPSFLNCSLSANHSDIGGAYYTDSSTLTLTHCILWANTATSSNPQVFGPVTASSSANLIQGGSGAHVTITTNPNFVRNPDPGLDGLWSGLADNDYGNLLLIANSPAIGAGSNAAYDSSSSIAIDLFGAPRKVATIDLGAYEGAYTTFEFLFPTLDRNADENRNGLSNFVDYALGVDPTGAPNPTVFTTFGNGQITFSHRAQPSADTVPLFQHSSDLENWQEMIEGVDYTVNNSNTIGIQVFLTLDLLPPALPPGSHFFRQGFVGAN